MYIHIEALEEFIFILWLSLKKKMTSITNERLIYYMCIFFSKLGTCATCNFIYFVNGLILNLLKQIQVKII